MVKSIQQKWQKFGSFLYYTLFSPISASSITLKIMYYILHIYIYTYISIHTHTYTHTWLVLKQHGFELCEFTYTWIFFFFLLNIILHTLRLVESTEVESWLRGPTKVICRFSTTLKISCCSRVNCIICSLNK